MKLFVILALIVSVVVIGASAFYGYTIGVGIGFIGFAVGAFACAEIADRDDENL
jgi:hypothetical protein